MENNGNAGDRNLILGLVHGYGHDKLKGILKAVLPPIVITAGRSISRVVRGKSRPNSPAEWECVREGWNHPVRGWNVKSVLEVNRSNWDSFAQRVRGTSALDMTPPEAPTGAGDRGFFHNLTMSFGYVLALAGREKKSLSLLDWGGSLGHYYLLSKALLPSVPIAYFCKDVPTLCEYGQYLLPEITFFADDICFDRRYDLVLASGSLQYSRDWKYTLQRLAASAEEYLYVTRLLVVSTGKSFVVVQRPYSAGYNTEYLGWVINHGEFVSCATECGMELVREMFVSRRFQVLNAPMECEFRGFLFRRQN